MDVSEFIKGKREDIKYNTKQYRIMLEPKLKSISNRINHRIKNTLNNPQISNFKSLDSSYFLGQKYSIPNVTIKIVHEKITNILGKEIFVGKWESIEQDFINNFANLTGDK